MPGGLDSKDLRKHFDDVRFCVCRWSSRRAHDLARRDGSLPDLQAGRIDRSR